MLMLSPRPPRDNENPRPPSWEIQFISYLIVLLRASEARIRRREELDRSLAVALDEQRRRAA